MSIVGRTRCDLFIIIRKQPKEKQFFKHGTFANQRYFIFIKKNQKLEECSTGNMFAVWLLGCDSKAGLRSRMKSESDSQKYKESNLKYFIQLLLQMFNFF